VPLPHPTPPGVRVLAVQRPAQPKVRHLGNVPASVHLVRLQQHVAGLQVAVHCQAAKQQGGAGGQAVRQGGRARAAVPAAWTSQQCAQLAVGAVVGAPGAACCPVSFPSPAHSAYQGVQTTVNRQLHPPTHPTLLTNVVLVDVPHPLGHLLGGAQQGTLQKGEEASASRHDGGEASRQTVGQARSSQACSSLHGAQVCLQLLPHSPATQQPSVLHLTALT